MKNLFVLKFIPLIFLISLISCTEDESSKAIKKFSKISEEVLTELNEEVVEEGSAQDKAGYVYNPETGLCTDKEGTEGLNEGLELGECVNLENQNLVGLDFKENAHAGMSISGSTISDSKINFRNIVKYEITYDEDTQFLDIDKPFTKLVLWHLKFFAKYGKRIIKLNLRHSKLEVRIQNLELKLDANISEERTAKLTERLERVSAKHSAIAVKLDLYRSKLLRQKIALKLALKLAYTER